MKYQKRTKPPTPVVIMIQRRELCGAILYQANWSLMSGIGQTTVISLP